MFAYCGNNPVMGFDPCGYCLHRWDFWNDCKNCSHLSDGEKFYNYVVEGFARYKKVSNSINSTISTVSNALRQAGTYTQKTAQAAYNNVEVSVGLGLGLQGECDIMDGLSAGLGLSYDLIHLSLVDGEINLQQRFSQGADLTFLLVDILEPEEQYYSFLDLSAPNNTINRDAVEIFGMGAYLYAGASFSIGFDFATFFKDLDQIYWN